jgi:hypothetical protein
VKTIAATLLEGYKPQLAVIAAEGGDTSMWMQVANTLDKVAHGNPTPEQIGQYKLLFQHMLNTHNQKVQAFTQRAQIANGRLPQPLSDDEFKSAVTDWVNPHPDQQHILDQLPNPRNIQKLNPNSNPVAPGEEGYNLFGGGNYDGSTPLPPGASQADKQSRLNYLQRKAQLGGQ